MAGRLELHSGRVQPAPDPEPDYRLYADLADWWPLISPVAEYAEEAAAAIGMLQTAEGDVRDVLDLGSGGGHLAYYLAREFAMTLVDRSESMLDQSRRLNPGCAHVCADMRTVDLGRTFDAVVVHDAVDYMVTTEDLTALLSACARHLRPGGAVVVMPDHLRETFQPGTGTGGSDADDVRGVRFLEWTHDPDPTDTWVSTEYVFVLRKSGGTTRAVHETHRTGLFAREQWLSLLADAGLESVCVMEQTDDDRPPREFFVGRRS